MKRLKNPSPELKELVAGIYDYMEIDDSGCRVILCHYPIMTYPQSYRDSVWMIHGHVHFSTKEAEYTDQWVDQLIENRGDNGSNLGHIVNVGCMMPYMDYTPRTLEEIKAGYHWYYEDKGV